MTRRETRGMSARVLYGLAILALTMVAGCGGGRVLMSPENLHRGLVIVLPGIDGRGLHNEAAGRALCNGRTRLAVELYDWTSPLGPLFNQRAVERNRRAAAALAERIRAYRAEHPGGPVFVIGHSGGTAIAVWAAEALAEAEAIDGIILLASSLSPGYDLAAALSRTRRGIVSFYSSRDAALLGLGTTLFGTMDGRNTESAGKVGFRRPAAADAAAYARLSQVPWRRAMARRGHDGSHFGCLAAEFVSAYVAPLLTAREWNGGFLAAGPSDTGTTRAATDEALASR